MNILQLNKHARNKNKLSDNCVQILQAVNDVDDVTVKSEIKTLTVGKNSKSLLFYIIFISRSKPILVK